MAQGGTIKYGIEFNVNQQNLNNLKKELQNLKNLTGQNLIDLGVSKNLDDAEFKLKHLRESVSQLEVAFNKSFSSSLGTTNLTKFNNELKKMDLNKIAASFNSMGVAGQNAFRTLTTNILTTNLQLKESNVLITKMAETMTNTIKWGIASSAMNTFTGSVQKAFNYVKALDSSLNDIRIVTNKSAEEMEKFAIYANRSAQNLGTSTRDFTDAALIYYQQGLSDQEANARAEVTLKAANITGQSAKEVSEQLTSVWNGYKVNASEAESYIDKLAAVAATTAADLEELSTGMSKVASAANLMGVDIDQLNAQLATIVSVTRQAPETVGTALKTIYARISDIKSGLSDETTLGNYTSKMAAYGFNVLDATGKLRDMGDVIEEIGNKWNNLSREQQVGLSQTIAGTRQYNNLLALFDNWSMYSKAIDTSRNSLGTLQKQQDIYMERTSAHLQQLSTATERVYKDIIDTKGLNNLVDLLTKATSGIANYIEAIGGSGPMLMQLGAVLSNILGPKIAQGFATTISNFKKMGENAKQVTAEIQILEQFKGIKINDATYNKIVDMKKQFIDLNDTLTEEQREYANSLIQTTNELANQKDEFIANREQAEQFYASVMSWDTEDLTVDFSKIFSFKDSENIINDINQKVKEFKGSKADFDEILTDSSMYSAYEEKVTQILESGAIKNKKITDDLKKSLADLNAQIKKDGSIDITSDAQREKLESFKIAYQKMANEMASTAKKTKDIINQQISGVEVGYETSLDKINSDYQTFIDKIKIQYVVEKFTQINSSILMLGSSIKSVGRLFSVWDDENLSTGEKILQTIMAVSNAAMGLVHSYKLVHTTAELLNKAFLGNTAQIYANTLAQNQNTKQTDINKNSQNDLEIELKEGEAAQDDLQQEIYQSSQNTVSNTSIIEANTKAIRQQTAALIEQEKVRKNINNEDISNQKLLQPSLLNKVTKDVSEQAKEGVSEGTKLAEKITNFGINNEEEKKIVKQLSLDDINPEWDNVTTEVKKTTEAIKQTGNATKNLNKKGLLSTFKEDWSTIGKAIMSIPPAAWIAVAAVAAIGAVIYLSYLEATKLERRIKHLKETISEVNQHIEDLKSTVDDLKSSFDNWKSAEEALSQSIKYSDEWNQKLQDVNSTIESILLKYPELLQIEDIINRNPDTGKLQLNEDKFADFIEQQEKKVSLNTQASYILQQELAYQQRNAAYNQAGSYRLASNIQSYNPFSINPMKPTYLSKEDIDKLRTVSYDKDKFSQAVQEILISMASKDIFLANGVTLEEFYSSIMNNREAFNTLNTTLIETENRLKNINNYLVPEEVAKSGKYASALYRQENENLDLNLKTWIRDAERKGVNQASGKGSKDAQTFMRNYIESQGGIWDSSKFEDVTGNDENRRYIYNGKELDADEMAAAIAAAVSSGEYTFQSYYKDDATWGKWEDLKENISKELPNIDNIISQSQKDIENLSTQLNISKELADKILAKDLDSLTTEDIEVLNNLKLKDEQWVEILSQFKILGEEGAKQFVEGFQDYDMEKAAENLKNEIEAIYQEGAEATGETIAGLKDVAKMFQETEKGANLSEKELAQYAVTAAKFRKNMSSLSSVVNDNEEHLEEWIAAGRDYTKMSREAALASQTLQTSIKETFGVDIDIDVLQDNFDIIKKAINGDKDALIEFQKLLANNQIDDFKLNWDEEISETDKQALIAGLNMQIDDIIDQTKDLEIGAKFNDKEALDSINQFVKASGMSTAQIQDYFDKIGYDAEVDVEPVKQQTKHSIGIPFAGALKAIGINVPDKVEWTTNSDIMVPVVKSLKKANNFTTYKPSTTTTGSKGGSSNTKTAEPVKTDIDRYHKIDAQITKTDNALSKLQSQTEKLLGKNWLDNLTQQWELLNIQIDNYNEKLRIANEEQNELAEKLSAQGVTFNADGTINNYAESIRKKETEVNKLVQQYNQLSSKKKDQWDKNKTIENAKEELEQLKTDLDRYDELKTDFIPNLNQSIQDAFDKKIEISIEKFNKEIEITLEMNQATRDWNEWKKHTIDRIKEEDILGTATARFQDIYSYLNSKQSGDIQATAKHLQEVLDEYKAIDESDFSVFGDNRAKALENLKEQLENLENAMSDFIDLEDEMYQYILDEMDRVQEKFDEQIESYEYLRELLDHDIKVIQLVYGEDAYGELSKFYQAQQDNYIKQLDFQRQQKEFWYEQMQMAEENSKEWESARDKWKEALTEFNSLLETSLENAKAKFENTINEIFKNLNNKVTNGMGLSYIKEEWDLINKNADQYLDTVNAIAGIQSIEKKYIDAINKSTRVQDQRKIASLMEEELNDLKQRDKLTQYDLDRAEKKYNLMLAQIALEDAQQNKNKMRLRRDSQGNYTYQYTADEDALKEAQNALTNAYNELYNFDKDRYKQVLNDIYSAWDEYQQKMAEAALINDPELRAQKELLIQEQYGELINELVRENQDIRENLQESAFLDLAHLYEGDLNNFTDLTLEERDLLINELGDAVIQLTGFYNDDIAAFRAMSEEQQDIIVNHMVPQWESGLQKMAENFYGPNGFEKQTIDAWNAIKDAETQYDLDLKELEDTADKTFESIKNGQDEDYDAAERLVKINEELINVYDEELQKVRDLWQAFKDLTAARQADYDLAKQIVEEAEQKRREEEEAARRAAEEDGDLKNSTSGPDFYTPEPEVVVTPEPTPEPVTGPQGNGIAEKGDIVTFDSGYYTANSYGGGGRGSSNLGKQVKITAIVTNGGSRPIHIATLKGGALGWVSKSQISGYDTGGYTGDWNNGGRLAFLHQKELVLNAKDTENMLNTVSIMRSLAYSLGSKVLSRIAGATATGYFGSSTEGGLLEQNVHIDAQFPNVHDAREIEEALNNLVNVAAQRAFENK